MCPAADPLAPLPSCPMAPGPPRCGVCLRARCDVRFGSNPSPSPNPNPTFCENLATRPGLPPTKGPEAPRWQAT